MGRNWGRTPWNESTVPWGFGLSVSVTQFAGRLSLSACLRLCHSSQGFLSCRSTFWHFPLPPCPPLPHVAPIFVSCAGFSPCLTFPAQLTHLCPALTISFGRLPNILFVLHFLCWLRWLCAATGASHSIHLLHPCFCVPARGEGFWGSVKSACMPTCRRLAASYLRSFSPYAGLHGFRFSHSLLGDLLFTG